jgi:hypothetical protein
MLASDPAPTLNQIALDSGIPIPSKRGVLKRLFFRITPFQWVTAIQIGKSADLQARAGAVFRQRFKHRQLPVFRPALTPDGKEIPQMGIYSNEFSFCQIHSLAGANSRRGEWAPMAFAVGALRPLPRSIRRHGAPEAFCDLRTLARSQAPPITPSLTSIGGPRIDLETKSATSKGAVPTDQAASTPMVSSGRRELSLRELTRVRLAFNIA